MKQQTTRDLRIPVHEISSSHQSRGMGRCPALPALGQPKHHHKTSPSQSLITHTMLCTVPPLLSTALTAEQGPHSPLQPMEKALQQKLPPICNHRPLRTETEAGHDSSHSHKRECPRRGCSAIVTRHHKLQSESPPVAGSPGPSAISAAGAQHNSSLLTQL